MHLGNHNKVAALRDAKQYPKLDALAVLTERDKEAYEALLSRRAKGRNGRPRLVRIPNTVREMGGAKADLDARTILAAGRLTPQKGFDLLIPAYAPVAAAHPDWTVRIWGRGDQQPKLEALIEEHGVGGQVTLGRAVRVHRRGDGGRVDLRPQLPLRGLPARPPRGDEQGDGARRLRLPDRACRHHRRPQERADRAAQGPRRARRGDQGDDRRPGAQAPLRGRRRSRRRAATRWIGSARAGTSCSGASSRPAAAAEASRRGRG